MTPVRPAAHALAIGRTTFDVARGTEIYESAVRALERVTRSIRAAPAVVAEPAEISTTLDRLSAAGGEAPDVLVVVLATFTDTRLISTVLHHTDTPLLLWAFPEPRTGHPLQLNSLTGLNLATYHLGRTTRPFRWLYADPASAGVDQLLEGVFRGPPVTPSPLSPASTSTPLRSGTIGVVGAPPDGFDPCDLDGSTRLAITTEHIPITELFVRAREAPENEVTRRLERLCRDFAGWETLDPIPVRDSIRLEAGLRSLAVERGWDGVAVRCWPECFNDFGAACCGPIASLTNDGIAASCEADALGVLTSLVLQDLAGSPAFVADLVDLQCDTDTGVLWHCGSAPRALGDARSTPEVSVHANRHLPVIHQFGLAPGPATIARLSQSRRGLRLVIGRAEVLDVPRPFAGTCGVVRFEGAAAAILETIIEEGLEHHYVVVAGDRTDGLERFAADHGLDVVALGRRTGAGDIGGEPPLAGTGSPVRIRA